MTASSALALARGSLKGDFSASTMARIRAAADAVETMAASDQAVYGINTGFGPLCNTRISPEHTRLLQHKLLISHSVGVGTPIDPELSRLMLVLKIQALAQGYSGIHERVLERLLWHLEADIIPVVPEQGSVGASGDLAPLSHLFLPLIGAGKVWVNGHIQDSAAVLQAHGLASLALGPKAGLALINGTQFIAAHTVRLLDRMHACLNRADWIAAMMLEGLLGSPMPFHHRLHGTRPFKGNQHVAHRIWHLLEGSEIVASHAACDRVQDPYSLRCIPQVHGASRHAWLHLKELAEVELNAVTDNPVIFDADFSISGGNFHGQPLALPLDYACLALSELGNIADRRIYLSIDGRYPGIPKLLMKETGLNSGFMILQYTAAALASENKTQCFPASADSITTSLGQEDHVSMGSISGRKALRVCQNLERIQAIELLCAAQALDFRRPLRSTPPMEALHAAVRTVVPHATEDRIFAEDIERVHALFTETSFNDILHGYTDLLDSPHRSHFELY